MYAALKYSQIPPTYHQSDAGLSRSTKKQCTLVLASPPDACMVNLDVLIIGPLAPTDGQDGWL